MKTGSVFIPTAKDCTSVLILRLHGYLPLIVLNLPSNGMNTAVCWTSVFLFFFPLTKSRASLCFVNRLPVKSRRCRSYSLWRISFNADMDRCLWFSRRGRSGTRRRQVRRTRRCHFPWCRWTHSRAQATWPRSRHRRQISFRIRATCRLADRVHKWLFSEPESPFLQPVISNPFHSNMCVCRLKWPSFRCMKRVWKAPSSVL